MRYADSDYWKSRLSGSSTETASQRAAREKRQIIDNYLMNNFSVVVPNILTSIYFADFCCLVLLNRVYQIY